MIREGSARLFVLAVSTAVAAAVIAGLVLVGSPGEARLVKLDHQRTSDLYRIVDSVNAHWTRHESLPADLNSLVEAYELDSITDPDTGQPYRYRPLGDNRYELCATFAKECPAENSQCAHWRARQDIEIRGHAAGEECYEISARVVDKQRAR